jgi:hypothetical protein
VVNYKESGSDLSGEDGRFQPYPFVVRYIIDAVDSSGRCHSGQRDSSVSPSIKDVVASFLSGIRDGDSPSIKRSSEVGQRG